MPLQCDRVILHCSVKELAVTVNRRVLTLALFICGLIVSDLNLLRPAAAQSKPAPQAAKDAKDTKDSKAPDEDWNVIYMGKTRVGYTRSTTSTVKRDGQELIRS